MRSARPGVRRDRGVPLRGAGLFRIGAAPSTCSRSSSTTSARTAVSMAPLARDVMTRVRARAAGRGTAVGAAGGAVRRLRAVAARGARLEDDPASVVAEQLEYWMRTLAGAAGSARPAHRPSPPAGRVDAAEPNQVRRSRRDCTARSTPSPRAERASLFMVVHARVGRCCSRRLSGTGDITVGTPIAGRGDAALDDLVGMFVNTLVLRTRASTSAMTFTDLLARARETDLAAFGNADVPFERRGRGVLARPARRRGTRCSRRCCRSRTSSRPHSNFPV